MSRVLVIEDNAASQRLAASILGKNSYEVLFAGTADEGLQLARREHPDLILMDIQLPGMSGMEAAQQLKADPATASIPVIALTAFAMKGDRERMLAAGCDGYLTKPYHYRDLLAMMEQALRSGMNKA